VLEVEPSVDANDLRKAFKRLALVRHPDKGGTSKAFRSLLHAYRMLSYMRKSYENEGAHSGSRRRASRVPVKRRRSPAKHNEGSRSKTESVSLSLDYGAPPRKRESGGAKPNAVLLRALRLLFNTIKAYPAEVRSHLLDRLSRGLKHALLSFAEASPEAASASTRSAVAVAAAVRRSRTTFPAREPPDQIWICGNVR
jgi:curved DNA-binding protein CbpA